METILASLVEELKNDVAIDVVVSGSDRQPDVLRKDGYTVYRVPSHGLLARTPVSPSMPFVLRRLLRQQSYDAAHLHFPNPLAHLASLLLPRRLPIVISWHSDIIRQRRLLRLYRPFLNRIVARSAAIVAATPRHFSSSTQLDACRSPSRLRVVPYGIDASRFTLTPQQHCRVESLRRQWSGQPLVFAIGRHVPYKGFDYLIRAMATVRKGVLLLGGRGPLTANLRSLALSLGIEDRVHFVGHIPDDELPALYHAADVFCMPSIEKSEAFGLVQLEAMLCRKPVVCCELDNGVTYVTQHGTTGLAIPPRDPQALATALETLLADTQLREQMGAAGHRRATSVFTLDRMREGMLGVYRDVLGRTARSGEHRRAA